MSPTVNDGSFESVADGGDNTTVTTPIPLGPVWTIEATATPAGWLDRDDRVLDTDGRVSVFQDAPSGVTTLTSVDILGTNGYSKVRSGDTFLWAFHINAQNLGTDSYNNLNLSFDDGSTWATIGTGAASDGNQNLWQIHTGQYIATGADAAAAASGGLRVRFVLHRGSGNNWSDNVRLWVIPAPPQGTVVSIR
jgi:hypothetical protein